MGTSPGHFDIRSNGRNWQRRRLMSLISLDVMTTSQLGYVSSRNRSSLICHFIAWVQRRRVIMQLDNLISVGNCRLQVYHPWRDRHLLDSRYRPPSIVECDKRTISIRQGHNLCASRSRAGNLSRRWSSMVVVRSKQFRPLLVCSHSMLFITCITRNQLWRWSIVEQQFANLLCA